MNFALPGLMNPQTPESDRVPEINALLPYTYGTTWEGIVSIGPVTFFGDQPAYPATSASFKLFGEDMVIRQELSSAADEVQITDPDVWTFSVGPITLSEDITPGLWKWTFSVVSNGVDEIVYSGTIVVVPAPTIPVSI